MRNPGGYSIAQYDDGRKVEAETFTCHHCGGVVHVKPKCDPYDLGGMCGICTKMICPACVNKGTCDPLEEKLQRAEQRYHALRSYGIG